MNKPFFHLSLTGPMAGIILCLGERDPAMKSIHASLVDFSAPYAQNCCPTCKEIWNSDDEIPEEYV